METIQKRIDARKISIQVMESTSTKTPTPMKVVSDMITALPDSVWSDPTLKWLDQSVGRGTFLLCVFERLMETLTMIQDPQKRATHIISNMLYGCDSDEEQYRHARKTLLYLVNDTNVKVNLFNEDSLTRNWNHMKFDIIIGNPPFHLPSGDTSRKLYVDMTMKAYEHLKDDGILSFITPRAILVPSHKNRAAALLASNSINAILFSADNHFTVSQDVCAWVLQKTKNVNNNSTKVVHKDDSIDYQQYPNIYDNSNKLCFPIIEKLMHKKDKSNKAPIGQSSQGRGVRNAHLFNHEVENSVEVYTNTKKQRIKYTQTPIANVDKRLIIPYNGGYMDDGQIFISDRQINEQFFVSVKVPESQLESLKSYMKSKLVSYVVINYQSRYKPEQAYNMLFSLAAPKLHKIWTDIELYEEFNISEDEQSEIQTWWDQNKNEK